MIAPEIIAFDGDDTLWHNEPLFWNTSERFKELLAPYADPTALASRILATERANLALFGYGIKGFVLSLIETAIQVSDGQVPTAVIAEMLERGKEMLAHPVHLLDGARETLEALHGRVPLVLITKGDLFDQEGKLARSGLAELFDRVEIVSEKDAATYSRIFGDRATRALMVGNSVRSDILPALEAGGWAVHVPYPITWAHEQADPPHGHPRFRQIAGLAELPGVIEPHPRT